MAISCDIYFPEVKHTGDICISNVCTDNIYISHEITEHVYINQGCTANIYMRPESTEEQYIYITPVLTADIYMCSGTAGGISPAYMNRTHELDMILYPGTIEEDSTLPIYINRKHNGELYMSPEITGNMYIIKASPSKTATTLEITLASSSVIEVGASANIVLGRYRLLSEMDDDTLSVYDSDTIKDVDYIITS